MSQITLCPKLPTLALDTKVQSVKGDPLRHNTRRSLGNQGTERATTQQHKHRKHGKHTMNGMQHEATGVAPSETSYQISDNSVASYQDTSMNEANDKSYEIISGQESPIRETTRTPRKHRTPRKKKSDGRDKEMDDQLELMVDPDQDDLDTDKHDKRGKQTKGGSYQHYGGARQKTKIKNTKRDMNESIDTRKKSPRKRKQSVATRVSNWPSPSVLCNSQDFAHDLFNDESFAAENQKADQEMERANRLLVQNERRAELAKKKL